MSENSKKFKLSGLLKNFDYFGAQIQFRINNEGNYRSSCGGLIFLMYFLISFVYVIYNFISFVNKENMTLIFTYKIKEPPVPVNLTEEKFALAIGVMFDDNNTIAVDETAQYLDYFMKIITVRNSGLSKSEILVPLSKCTPRKFYNEETDRFNSIAG